MLLPKLDLLEGVTREQRIAVYRLVLSLADAGPHVTQDEKDFILAYMESDSPITAEERRALLESIPPLDRAVAEFRAALPRNVLQTFHSWSDGILHAQTGMFIPDWRGIVSLQWPENKALIDLLLSFPPEEDRSLIADYDACVEEVYEKGPREGVHEKLAKAMGRLPGVGISSRAVHKMGEWGVSLATTYGNIDPEGSEAYHFAGAGLPFAYVWAALTRLMNNALERGDSKAARDFYMSYFFHYSRYLFMGYNDKYFKKKRNASADARAEPFRQAFLRARDTLTATKLRSFAAPGSQGSQSGSLWQSHRFFIPAWYNPTKKAIKAGTYIPVF